MVVCHSFTHWISQSDSLHSVDWWSSDWNHKQDGLPKITLPLRIRPPNWHLNSNYLKSGKAWAFDADGMRKYNK